ncbi:MAG: hypothetical protein ACK5NY_05435, partial [Burkholderiaceae bacterium]
RRLAFGRLSKISQVLRIMPAIPESFRGRKIDAWPTAVRVSGVLQGRLIIERPESTTAQVILL